MVLIEVKLELARYLVFKYSIYSYLIVIFNPELKLVYKPIYSLQLFRFEASSRSFSLFSFKLLK